MEAALRGGFFFVHHLAAILSPKTGCQTGNTWHRRCRG
jgi:hypothetical protein